MDSDDDVSQMIARVTAQDAPAAAEIDATPVSNDLFFPKSETAFTEVPVFRHQNISALQN